jgi:hypothetical protein
MGSNRKADCWCVTSCPLQWFCLVIFKDAVGPATHLTTCKHQPTLHRYIWCATESLVTIKASSGQHVAPFESNAHAKLVRKAIGLWRVFCTHSGTKIVHSIMHHLTRFGHGSRCICAATRLGLSRVIAF